MKITAKELRASYPYTTELHAHTFPVSPCSEFSPEELVARYAKRGVNAIVITNHLTSRQITESLEESAELYLRDYYEAVKAGEALGVTVVLGAEIRFHENNNDYLVYGISPEDILTMAKLVPDGIENFYRVFKNDKNVILQAHPFRAGAVRAPLGSVDGVEAYNLHPGHNSSVGRAALYAREHDLIVSGGTDFHHPGHEAMCLMRTEMPIRDSFDVAEVLKARAAIFDAQGSLILPYAYE